MLLPAICGQRLLLDLGEEREGFAFVPRGEALLLHAKLRRRVLYARGHPGVPWPCCGVLMRT